MKDILEHIGIKSFEEGAKHVCFVGADRLPNGYYGTSIRREVINLFLSNASCEQAADPSTVRYVSCPPPSCSSWLVSMRTLRAAAICAWIAVVRSYRSNDSVLVQWIDLCWF